MHELIGDLAVIGEDEKSLGIHVESSAGIYTLRNVRKQLRNAAASLVVAHGGDIAARLIQHHIQLFAAAHDRLAFIGNFIDARHNLLADRRFFAVDREMTGLNLFFGGAARHKATIRNVFLYAHFFHKNFLFAGFFRTNITSQAWYQPKLGS